MFARTIRFMGKLITKTDAARQLLDRALELFLDQNDFLAAMVLAGAAEDVFRDYLLRAGKEPSRDSIAIGTVQIANLIDPNGEPLRVKDVASAMRFPYNWPRHHDRDDPDSLEIDWEDVAEQIISRASNDMAAWTSDLPLRVNEFDERRKSRQLIARKAKEITAGDWIVHDSQLALVREVRLNRASATMTLLLDPCDGEEVIGLICDADAMLMARL
jgi:hypothetical protein